MIDVTGQFLRHFYINLLCADLARPVFKSFLIFEILKILVVVNSRCRQPLNGYYLGALLFLNLGAFLLTFVHVFRFT